MDGFFLLNFGIYYANLLLRYSYVARHVKLIDNGSTELDCTSEVAPCIGAERALLIH